MSRFEATPIRPAYAVTDAQSRFLCSVFGWMALGLAITFLVSVYVLYTPAVANTLLNGMTLIVLFVVEIGLVIWLSARVMKMSAAKATTVFLLYAAINGITLAPLAWHYTGESIASVFMITAGMFGSMALYGYATKKDLTGWGRFLYMGLIGVLIAIVVNIFLNSPMVSYVISLAGVLVFTGLTAYDVNKLKRMAEHVDSESTNFRRFAILGALTLYLDFINLFIMLLRLFGNRD